MSADRVLAAWSCPPSAATRRHAARDLLRLPRNPQRPTQLGGHQSAGQRDVRGPLAGDGVGHRAGLQVWQAPSVHLVVHVEQLGRRHHQPRKHHLGPAEQQRRADPALEREAGRQRCQQRVDVGVDPLGDRQRRVRAAGRRLTRNPRLRAGRPRCAGPPPRCPRRRPARRNGPSADQARDPLGVERRRAHGLELVAS